MPKIIEIGGEEKHYDFLEPFQEVFEVVPKMELIFPVPFRRERGFSPPTVSYNSRCSIVPQNSGVPSRLIFDLVPMIIGWNSGVFSMVNMEDSWGH